MRESRTSGSEGGQGREALVCRAPLYVDHQNPSPATN